ncbi:MAG: asparagine synthase (glutamine-hydrolyzing) [Chitinophagales bacterium]
MCGITGYYTINKSINGDDLERMTTSLSHRGPDAAGYFFSENQTTGLGHRRLSIIDLSNAANQPMHSQNGRYTIVFNGEVYNFAEVREKLGILPRTSSDTEIILEAFALKGAAAVQLFNGMFALAIYDQQMDTLHLFRDRLGVKPLYYYHNRGNFVFGSEMKALLQAPVVKNDVAVYKPAVHTFLYAGYVPEPYTIYDNIKRLPAGTYATLNGGELTITAYWKPEEKIEPRPLTDFQEAKKTLRGLLETSVAYRMISDVPFGTFLSGGIDSSTVTALAQHISPKPVKTFSIGFKEAKHNESEFARQVANHLKTEHYEFTVTEQDALELIDKMTTAYDEPYADSSALPTMLVSRLARKHVTMTLSGDGGDELFMGYGAYNWASRMSNPLLRLLRGPIALAMQPWGNRYKRVAGLINYTSEERIKSHIFSQEQYFFSEAELQRILKKDYVQPVLFNEHFEGLKRNLTPAEEQALFDLKHYLKDDLLVKVDVASMQYSLEARTPFLDYRVVEFALNLAPELKQRAGSTKYLLKEVLYEFVPRELFERPKWGFSIPLDKWLRTDLHYLIDQYLSNEVIEKHGVAQPNIVRKLIYDFEGGQNHLYNRIWVLVLLHKWLEEAGCR